MAEQGDIARRDEHKEEGERVAERHRQIQQRQETIERKVQEEEEESENGAVQSPDRRRPEPPQPEQHQEKPGSEKELEPRPLYKAPNYRGSGKLQDMVAIITGGDSGIGRAVAVLFAREGADVALVYLSEHEDATETARAIKEEGRRALLIPGDVSGPSFCIDAVEQTVKHFGRLDILVNNAAFQQHSVEPEQISDEQFDRTMKTNLYGYFYMARAALPHLKEGSSIINCGSVTGIRGSGALLDYSITKGGIHSFTKSLAQSVVDRGIRVNAVSPGPVWTPLNPADKPAEQVAEFGSDVPMGRPAQPEEIAPAFVFLAAPSMSSYISGLVLPVLGGETV